MKATIDWLIDRSPFAYFEAKNDMARREEREKI